MNTKYIRRIGLFFFCFGCLTLSACRDASMTIPFDVKWDVRNKDSMITKDFSVSRDGSYDFVISFRIMDSKKDISKLHPQLQEIVGDGGNPHPGVIIPVHIKIETINVNKVGQKEATFDATVKTRELIRSGYGGVDRKIASVHLAPGRYTATVSTDEVTSLPDWIETYFSATYFSK
jgi:hypothetical protein